jgi:hypothetical protein
MRKQEKAFAASRAMGRLAESSHDLSDEYQYMSGWFGAIGAYHGFLSTKTIESEIATASSKLPDFAAEYELEINK